MTISRDRQIGDRGFEIRIDGPISIAITPDGVIIRKVGISEIPAPKQSSELSSQDREFRKAFVDYAVALLDGNLPSFSKDDILPEAVIDSSNALSSATRALLTSQKGDKRKLNYLTILTEEDLRRLSGKRNVDALKWERCKELVRKQIKAVVDSFTML